MIELLKEMLHLVEDAKPWKSWWLTSEGKLLEGDKEYSGGDHFGFIFAGEKYPKELGIFDKDLITKVQKFANMQQTEEVNWDIYDDLAETVFLDFANAVLNKNARVGQLSGELYLQTRTEGKSQFWLELVQKYREKFENYEPIRAIFWEDTRGFYDIPAEDFWAANNWGDLRAYLQR